MSIGETDGANYTTGSAPSSAGDLQIPVKRGWLSVEGRVRESETDKRPVPFRQHAPRGLRGGHDPRGAGEGAVRAGWPARHPEAGHPGRGPQLRHRGGHNIQGTDQLAFSGAARRFGMTDNGAIQSCCYSDLFDPTRCSTTPSITC